MFKRNKNIFWLEEVDQSLVDQVGRKATNLGDLVQAGFNVPRGFVLPHAAIKKIIRINQLDRTLEEILKTSTLDLTLIDQVTQLFQKKIENLKLPKEITDQLEQSWNNLNQDSPLLIARVSLAPTQNLSIHYDTPPVTLRRVDDFKSAIAQILKSLFSAHALYSHQLAQTPWSEVKFAIVFQEMVNCDTAGTLATHDRFIKDAMVIKGIWGLGYPLSHKTLTPDVYIIDKSNNQTIDRKIAQQDWQLEISKDGQLKHSMIPVKNRTQRKISETQLQSIATQALKVEKHFQLPQMIEWGMKGNELAILNTTTLNPVSKNVPINNRPVPISRPILNGTSTRLGHGFGRVKFFHPNRSQNFSSEDVLVSDHWHPQIASLTPAAVVIDSHTDHNFHKEFKAPTLTATRHAVSFLHPGELITVDAFGGNIFSGKKALKHQTKSVDITSIKSPTSRIIVRYTPSHHGNEKIPHPVVVDGVTLASKKNLKHPLSYENYGQIITDQLDLLARANQPYPVIYSLSDWHTNHFQSLQGSQGIEEHEEIPFVGWRGAARYIDSKKLLNDELRAISETIYRRGHQHVWLNLPFVRSKTEIEQLVREATRHGLPTQGGFKILIGLETPAAIYNLEDWLMPEVDGVIINADNLATLALGADLLNKKVSHLISENIQVVENLIKELIQKAHNQHRLIFVSGNIMTTSPNLLKTIIDMNPSGVIVHPKSLSGVTGLVHSLERLRS